MATGRTIPRISLASSPSSGVPMPRRTFVSSWGAKPPSESLDQASRRSRRQRDPRPRTGRWHAGQRLRTQAVPPGLLPGAAQLRPYASLSPRPVFRGGWRVASVPVNHRPRRHGRSHYGVLDRLWAGIPDLVGVLWLQHRPMRPVNREDPDDVEPCGSGSAFWARRPFRFASWCNGGEASAPDRSVVPTAFWHLSLGGGLLLLVYAITGGTRCSSSASSPACFVYLRNLHLIRRSGCCGNLTGRARPSGLELAGAWGATGGRRARTASLAAP